MAKLTVGRAFYNGIFGGLILGLGIAFLMVLYIFGQSGYPASQDIQYAAFLMLVLGIVIVAYDAHKVASAPRL